MSKLQKNRVFGQNGACEELESRQMLAGSASHNFNDGSLGPFTSNNTGDPQTFRVGTAFVPRFRYDEYDGTRNQRGYEIRNADSTFQKRAVMSFDLLVPRTTADEPFPDDKTTIIHQWYNWSGEGRPNNWTAHLSIEDNDMYATYRAAATGGTKVLVMEDVPRNQYFNIEQAFRLGQNGDGRWRIRIDGETAIDLQDINVGWAAEWDSNGTYGGNAAAGMKTGIYAANTGEYEEGDNRYLRYDNMSISSNDNP